MDTPMHSTASAMLNPRELSTLSPYPKFIIGSPISTGNLRFNIPLPNLPYTGNINATSFGNLCYNFNPPAPPPPTWITLAQIKFLSIFAIPPPAPFDEDCASFPFRSFYTP